MAKVLDKPELLAPAGDEESLRAAVAAGADAVYFGLRGGFNARARADNFSAAELPRIFRSPRRPWRTSPGPAPTPSSFRTSESPGWRDRSAPGFRCMPRRR
jgi:hypothetical protein